MGGLDHYVYLPLVVKNAMASPGDALIVSWTQTTEGGTRMVLLHWRSRDVADMAAAAATGGSYAVSRRVEGQTTWQSLGNAVPAATPTAMVSILGQDLADQLAYDLRSDPEGPPLALQQLFDRLRTDTATARLLAQQYYQVGLATGMAYYDRTAPLNVTLEYKVVPLVGNVGLMPARVPSGVANLPVPTGVRPVWTGPDGLGVRPSGRPDTAPERYAWIGAQAYRPWNGTVYLIWDLPTQGVGNGGTLDDGLSALNLAGYRVYRAAHGTGVWESVSPRKADCVSKAYCEILTGAMLPPETDDGFPQFFFKETLYEVLSDPAQLYRQWDYKVCPVDGLRREGTCSAVVSVDVRELMAPAPVNNLQVQVDGAAQTALQFTWVYSDVTEVSLPLRFYVTRSPALTLPAEQWTPVIPAGTTLPYQTLATSGPATLSITDVPPKDQVFWYRVQVRDNAGNWSAPGQAVKGALYTRTDPAFPAIPYNASDCSANALPLVLTGLGAEVRQVAVYRGFAAGGPWHLVKRVTVTGGIAVISDEYVPPYGTDVYYRLEAVDGHGNVSAAQPYCARLEGGPIDPPPPPITTTLTEIDGGIYQWEIEGGDPAGPDDGPPTVITVTLPGDGGPAVITQVLDGTASGTAPSGAWMEIDGSTTGSGGTGAATTSWERVTNNFIDTDRQMTDLGGLHNPQWIVSQSEPPYVQIGIVTVDEVSPPLALFRRIPGGAWLQVTEVRRVQPHTIEDRSDPSPDQTYEYAVLLFSPTTYEVLGYWGPTTLSPLYATPRTAALSSGITPVPGVERTCSYTPTRASDLGMPSTIALANGWTITGVRYWLSGGDPDCPAAMAGFDRTHAYGDGNLTNGVQGWAIRFYDIGVSIAGTHNNNRIVGALNYDAAATDSLFARRFGRIEFTPVSASAEVTITLPANLKVTTPTGNASRVYGVFENATTGMTFSALGLSASTAIVDENLPWRLQCAETNIAAGEITFGMEVTTADRLAYVPPGGVPDNNLGFLRATYRSLNAGITPSGLRGSFETDAQLAYVTSLPAGIEVSAEEGARVTIVDSRIEEGTLSDATARLTYYDRGTNIDLATLGTDCQGMPEPDYALCEWTFGTLRERTLAMTPSVPAGALAIGADGLVTATVQLDQSVGWPSFEVGEREATLFIAAAAPGWSGTTNAPLPAENAWRQLDHAPTGGRLDPGINLNQDRAVVSYSFYTPPEFTESAMDLYVRRGGVSGHLIMGGGGPRENGYGYTEEVQRIELLVIDNGTVSPPLAYETDLTLPYPTDAVMRLDVWQVNPSTNWPVNGGFREPTTLVHKYWNFAQTPRTWQYSPVGTDYGGALGEQAAVLALTNSRAAITGLGSQSAAPGTVTVTLALASEWLPDGDVGMVRLAPPPALEFRVSGFYTTLSGLRLSRYHSTPLGPAALPDTLGIDVGDNLTDLPEKLLDANGALTPASLAACAAGGKTGCGFVVVDGNVAVDYFGEVRAAAPASGAAVTGLDIDALLGMFPVAVNTLVSETTQLVVKAVELPWIWPLVNDVLDVDLPVKFLGNTQGGVLVGLYGEATIFPDEQIFRTDAAAVISIQWQASSGYRDKLGIFLGYPASQAAFRALAMNRPTWTGGIVPFDHWEDVEADVRAWAAKFGYAEKPGSEDDAVDLARDTWDSWCATWSGAACTSPRDFEKAYDVVLPILRDLGGREAYGVCGLEPGAALLPSKAYMNNGALAAVFHRDGLGLQLSALEGGTQMGYDAYYADLWITELDVFVRMDWLSVEMNRDGEILFYGEPYLNLIGDYGVDGEFFGMAIPDGGAWRVEAAVDLDTIGLAGVSGLDLAGEFGSGPFNGEPVSYLGVRGEGYYFDYRVGGGVLFGSIYKQSEVLRRAGYGELLDSLGNENTYTGIYLYLNGDFPIVEGTSCLLKASAAGELRFWYYWSDDIGGGTLSGAVHATVLCVISGRGQVDLGYARLDQGGTQFGRTCESAACDVFGGAFWVAMGVGWCEPHTWRRWESRWWGDDWCYTLGAYVDLSYMDPGGLDYQADLDYE